MGCRRVEHDLGTVHTECTPTFGEVAVVADVDADLADRGLEHGVAAVAGFEIKLLPEALHLGNVLLAVLAEVRAVGIDHCGSVVVHARLNDFVHRQHENHAEFLRHTLEPLRRRAIGDVFGVGVVLGILHLAEVRPVEELLEAHDLGSLLLRLVGRSLVLVDHGLFRAGPIGLQQCRSHIVRHLANPFRLNASSRGLRFVQPLGRHSSDTKERSKKGVVP